MSEYVPPIVTVDAVVLSIVNGCPVVLLHRRPNEPFRGLWALPGAYCSKEDSMVGVLQRTIDKKVDVIFDKQPYFEQLYTFDSEQRDPRGPTLSVAYLGVARSTEFTALPVDTAESRFFDIAKIPKDVAFDHKTIIQVARQRLRTKLFYTDIIKYILPRQFTLTQLQEGYELLSGLSLDKRNFRKKILALDILRPSANKMTGTAHRPAQLYEFSHRTLVELQKTFA